MHFVTGGAFNGKNQWVWHHYKLTKYAPPAWYNGRTDRRHHIVPPNENEFFIVSELEYYIKRMDNRTAFQEQLSMWLEWEKDNEHRRLILIGSDIGKGIVPIDQEDRRWRDKVGWCYQDVADAAKKIDIIWYGIAQPIKQID